MLIRGSTFRASDDGLLSPTRTQLDCLHVGYLSGFHSKSQQGPDEVPSVVAAGAGIHVNQSERLVTHDFQNVRVAADEQARPQPTDFLPGPTVVIAGIPADMGHVDVEALAYPNEIFRQVIAERSAIDVAVNTTHGFECSEAIQHFARSEIARVPHLVAFGEVTEDSVIQKAVGVGQQPDSHSPS